MKTMSLLGRILYRNIFFVVFFLLILFSPSLSSAESLNQCVYENPLFHNFYIDKLFAFSSSADFDSKITTLNVSSYKQQRALSCECAAAAVVSQFSDTTQFSESSCLDALSYYEAPLQNDVWGDPDTQFVGDVDGSQLRRTGWGVFATPLVKILHSRGLSATETSFASIGDITYAISNGKPVVVWVTSYFMPCIPVTWKTPENRTISSCLNEHTVVVTGFTGSRRNPKSIQVMDVADGKTSWLCIGKFMRVWEAMDSKMLVL
ncbi:MAG: C39 family peptidase [bacterium]